MKWRIERRNSVTSTMDVAADLAGRGAPDGTVVVADEQTAGRGRMGRVWLAPAGTCLLFTALFRPPLAVAQSPTLLRDIGERVAAAVAETTGVQPTIKEPNDLLIDGRKVAGILVQTSIRGDHLDYLLVGIGLNVNLPEDLLPVPTATSLLIATGREHDRDALLHAILRRLEEVPGLAG
ncbi:MAG: biotin--[acetyl-CoA-carboxylase] ligase [Sphaerobacter thermophilus]|uniref:biotin--[acetyl-CoA-carboxylase] ligase n=1 Tax=Sphaerobacter thermophilus TaxID=2057 RepID=UPI00396DF715